MKIHLRHKIVCEKCENEDLVFVTEYHKSIFLRFVNVILLTFIIGNLILLGFTGVSTAFFAFLPEKFNSGVTTDIQFRLLAPIILLYLFNRLLIYFIEAKTHVRVICKNCGKSWIMF